MDYCPDFHIQEQAVTAPYAAVNECAFVYEALLHSWAQLAKTGKIITITPMQGSVAWSAVAWATDNMKWTQDLIAVEQDGLIMLTNEETLDRVFPR